MAAKFVNNVNEKNLVLTRAQAAALSRDFPTAARLYKTLLKDDPSNVDYLKEIGSIYVKAGEDEKAIPYYEQIITFYPHYIDAMTALGAIYRRLKRYEESIDILTRAQDEERQTGTVFYNLGFTYKEMGNYDDAIDAFQIVISENPSDVLAYNHLGNIYLAKKDYQKSINSFKRGLQVDQNHPILNYNLARCYTEAKNYNDAIRCYENALKSRPGWTDAIRDFSALLVNCQKSEDASTLVQKAINVHPNDTKLLCALGRIYLNDFDYDSAEKTFKKADNINDHDLEILEGLFETYDKSGKTAEALDTAIRAKDMDPDNPSVCKNYASALLSNGEYDAAALNIRDMLDEKGRKDPEVLDLQGQYYICTGQDQKAQECFEQIKTNNRNYRNYKLSAAKRYSQIGNAQRAEDLAKDFIAGDIRNPNGYNTLGQIYSTAGNYQEALDSFEKSRHLKKPNVHADKEINKLLNQSADLTPSVSFDEFDSDVESLIDESTVDNRVEIAPLVESEDENKEDEFDFGAMGDYVPMGEALQEKEKDFFDEMDEELESQADEEEPEKPDYSNIEDSSISPFDALKSLEDREEETDKNALLSNSAMKDIPEEKEDFDFSPYAPKTVEREPELDNSNGTGGFGDRPQDGYGDNYGDRPLNDFAEKEENSYEDFYPQTRREPPYSPNQISDMVNQAAAENRRAMSEEQNRFEAQMAEEQRNFAMQMAEQQRAQALEQAEVISQLKQEMEDKLAEATGLIESDIAGSEYDGNTFAEENQETETFEPLESITEEEALAEDVPLTESAEPSEDVLISESSELTEDELLTEDSPLTEDAEPSEDVPLTEEPEISPETQEKIDLFQKLLSLCEYLPEDEREKFRSGKIRLQMEYLISAMSGKKGLLKATASKSGTSENEEGGVEQISNDRIKNLMKKMQELSGSLADPALGQSLSTSAEDVLEKIQIAEQDNQIFRQE